MEEPQPKMTPGMEESLSRVRAKIKDKLKKDDARVSVSMYSPEKEVDVVRAEGEEWQDKKGGHWKVENGEKIHVDPYKDARMPWWCPKCSLPMNHRNDTLMWRKKGMCFDCVLRLETQIRVAGLWDLYERRQFQVNRIAYLKDTLTEYRRYYEQVSAPTFVYENGTVERWSVDIKTIKADLQKDIERIAIALTTIEQEYQANDQSQLQRLADIEREFMAGFDQSESR